MSMDDFGGPGERRDVADLTSALGERRIERTAFLARAAALGVSLTAAEALFARAAKAAGRGQARPSATDAKVTITFWRHNYTPGVAIDRQLAKQYMALHPNVQVNVVQQGSTPQLDQKLLVAYSGGGAPDISYVYNGTFAQFAALGFFQPIDYSVFGADSAASFEKQWLKGALNGWTYNGQQYGIPGEAGGYVSAISPILFRQAGLDPVKDAPKTWEDIARIGPKLTKVKNGAIVQQGFGMPSYPSVMSLVFDSMIHQLGGSIVSADGKKGMINSPAGLKVLQTLNAFVNKEHISQLAGKPLQGPGFDTGSTAIIADIGPWYRGFLSKSDPKIYRNGAGLKFLPFPRFSGGKNLGGVPTGYAWCVNKHSPNAHVAWDFVKFLSDRTTMGYLSNGLVAPKASLFRNKKVMSNPDLVLAVKELATGAPFAAIPDQISTIIYAAVSHCLLDKADPKAALDQANQQLDQLLPTLSYKLSL